MSCRVLAAGCATVIGGFIGGAIIGSMLGILANNPGAGAVLGALVLGILGLFWVPRQMRKEQRFLDWYNRPFNR